MTSGDGTTKTTFRANVFSLRALLIFAAGFALALLMARTAPGVSFFHPAAQVIEKDVEITALNGGAPVDLDGFATSDGKSFLGSSDGWDADLLNEAFAARDSASRPPVLVSARIKYVALDVGALWAFEISRRE